ncbi:MAG: ABC transporter substrate-binding protein [Thermoanaerobacteraceae bacterium]
MAKKRWLPLVLTMIFLLSIFLTSCSKPNTSSQQTPEQNASKPTPVASVSDGDSWIKGTDPTKIPAESKKRMDTIVIGIGEPKGVFNPLFSETAYDNYVNNTIFDGLIDVALDGSYIPSLAKSWDIDKDNKAITFHLRDDVKFSDGTPLTAKDVEFSYYVLADPQYDGPSDLSSAKIKGFDAYFSGNADKIEGIKVLDDHTIKIELDELLATTLGNLGTSVIPQHYYGKDFSKGKLDGVKALHQQPLGTGRYTLEKYVPGQEVRLKANPNYWNGVSKVQTVIFKPTTDETALQLLQTGTTDYEADNISAKKDNVDMLQSLGFVDVSLLPNNGYGYIAFNHKLPQFKDVRVRQALAYGLNRKAIVDAVYQGAAEVLNVPQSKVSWSFPDKSEINPYDFNPDKAKQLLDEAGWKLGSDGYRYKDGKKFVIHFAATSPNPVNDAIIPYATENYKDLGIEFIPEQLEFNAVIDKINKGDFEMYFLAWGLTPEPDPTNLFSTKGSQNKIGYSNPKADELMKQGRMEFDQAKRAQIYKELYKLLNEDLPYIFMYQRQNMNSKNCRIVGFQISPYRDFTNSLNQVEILEY